jgi:hypothetical protein
MPDNNQPPSAQRQRRVTDRIGYLTRDQRRELELLEQLFQAPDLVVRFRPASRTMRGYQVFTTSTVWYLVHLAQRGWVELTERRPAGPEEDQWWAEIAVTLTAIGRTNYLALKAKASLEERMP